MQGVSGFFGRGRVESGYYLHSAERRARVRANLRKMQAQPQHVPLGRDAYGGFGGIHVGLAFLLVPLLVVFMMLSSGARVMGCDVRGEGEQVAAALRERGFEAAFLTADVARRQ